MYIVVTFYLWGKLIACSLNDVQFSSNHDWAGSSRSLKLIRLHFQWNLFRSFKLPADSSNFSFLGIRLARYIVVSWSYHRDANARAYSATNHVAGEGFFHKQRDLHCKVLQGWKYVGKTSVVHVRWFLFAVNTKSIKPMTCIRCLLGIQ